MRMLAFVACIACVLVSACQPHEQKQAHTDKPKSDTPTFISSTTAQTQANDKETAPPLVTAARSQIGVTTSYDPTYRNLAYPMGDVATNTGVCTDVVIRAYRKQHIDLQVLVNQDMKKAWQAYPKTWGLARPDTNIDHRRVPNLEVFFARNGKTLSITDKSSFKAGDLVTWRLTQGTNKLPHIGIVSNKKTWDGTPLIIHNIGRGTEESDILYKYPIIGHYRY